MGAATTVAPGALPRVWAALTCDHDPEAIRGALAYQAGTIAWLASPEANRLRPLETMQGHWERLSTALLLGFGAR